MEILVGSVALLFLGSLIVPTFSRTCAKGNITKTISNGRQIITALRIYSSEHGGFYPDWKAPDALTSNEVFRELFRKGATDNEKIFGAPLSRFVPDGDIGTPPDYAEAVKAGENHWAMTARVSDSDNGALPLVYESPTKATWPPTWNPDAKGTDAKGRAWSNGIVVGFNDCSIMVQRLQHNSGSSVPLKKLDESTGGSESSGKDIFEMVVPEGSEPFRILDVAVPGEQDSPRTRQTTEANPDEGGSLFDFFASGC